jgi:methylthioribose-1-phosphate isomerase
MRPWGDAEALSGASYSVAELSEDATRLFVLDQRLLPDEETYLTYGDVAGAAESIRAMVVRGAPAIGITAAYGMTLAAHAHRVARAEAYLTGMRATAATLQATRPTAVNLQWALRSCTSLAAAHASEPGELRHRQLAAHARTIHREDVAACRAMGRIGAEWLGGVEAVLTHCNAGALATGGYGSALGVIRAAAALSGGTLRVLAGETRPYLQGARLTAWELHRDGIDVTVVSDNMVAHCMSRSMVEAVVVGADRIAQNGDVANKIGTYGIALLARQHGIPFYVAAPWSTVDLDTATGADIPIEQRAARELTHLGGRRLVPEGVKVYNPAFDVTPAELVTAIITERGALPAVEIASLERKG